jgi:formyltetrahydrofolate-dependent phosphoribosylglycinamide formyltransferase
MPEDIAAAVFASGGGSNFQSLLDHQATDPPWRIRLLVADRQGIGALDRGERAGVPTRVIPTKGRDAADVASEMLGALESHGIDVILLAGYLKLIPAPVVAAYRRRILNIHPALLPSFGGKGMYGTNVHRAVLESGTRISGPTVHFVDEEYDRGTIVAQWPVPVLPDDTPEALAARVLKIEHLLYPRVADHLCRALAEHRQPGPLVLPGEAFTTIAEAADAALATPDHQKRAP